jgi:hypothetical protein
MDANFKATEFIVGVFIGFLLTISATSYIIVTEFVAKDFLRQNNIYLDGNYYKLCKRGEK